MNRQGRGELTERIKIKSKELFGYEIDIVELRLMPYIQYLLVNNQKLIISKINNAEREIIKKWKFYGYIKGGLLDLVISKEFWDMISEIIFLAYVDIGDK